jgi:predicted SAM-dependent methyltransferase
LRSSIGLLFPANVKYGDIVRGLPVDDGSASGVYSSHVLEHLARDDLPRALQNAFGILRPGGSFRLVVPDLYWRVARYLLTAKAENPHAADNLMSSCRLGMKSKAKNVMALAKNHIGHTDHLWMYDYPAMKALLHEVGFVDIRRCAFGDSKDPMFALVEDRSRFFEGTERELAIEALRPAA